MNQIIEAIATNLGDYFPECEIYIENTDQALTLPCFIIRQLPGSQRDLLGGDRVRIDERYTVSFLMPEGKVRELREKTVLACLYLRWIYIDGKPAYKPIGIQHTFLDDDASSVITFMVSTTAEFRIEDPRQLRLIHSTEVKNGEKEK